MDHLKSVPLSVDLEKLYCTYNYSVLLSIKKRHVYIYCPVENTTFGNVAYEDINLYVQYKAFVRILLR